MEKNAWCYILQHPLEADIEESPNEAAIRGPEEESAEALTLISLVRRKLRSPKLKSEIITLGTITQTRVSLVYVEGVCRADL